METSIDRASIEIEANARSAITSLEILSNSINKLNVSLNNGLKGVRNFNVGLKSIKSVSASVPKSIKKINSAIEKTGKGKKPFIDRIFEGKPGSFLKFGLLTSTIFKAGQAIGGFVGKTNEYIENSNLFAASLGENTKKAKEFIDVYTKALGVDPSDTMRYMGMFSSLTKGFGIASDKSYIMSKNLTQLSYDLSSFENLSIEESMQKLKSGIAGEIEPMRAIGIALDQATLQETAYALGIDKRVNKMTRAQKTELLYYQIMKRSQDMLIQGDMARTLLTPANALRVLQQQFTQLARAIGKIFIPMLMAVIPYVQILTKWLTALANTIAHFFGFEMPDIDYPKIESGLGGISGGIDGVGDSADKTKKKLDRMLGKFDELNVIEFDKDKGSGSGAGDGIGGGGSLGIPLPEYDPLKGLVNKNLEEAERKLKNILPYVEAIGGALLTWKIGSSVLNFLDKIGLLEQFGLKLSNTLRILAGVSIILGGAWLIYKGIKQAIDDKGITPNSLLKMLSGGLLVGTGASLMFKKIAPLRIAAGLTLAIEGAYLQYSGQKKLLSGDLSTQTFLELLGGSVGLGVGTFVITKNVKLALIVTAFTLAFNIGEAIGMWINENFGDSYDWYLKKFNVHLENGIDFTDVLGVIGTMLGTIGDVILTGLGKLWNIIPPNVQDGIKKAFRVSMAVLTGGLSEIILLLIKNWDKISKFFMEDIPNFFTETIPNIGKNILDGIQEVWNNFVNFFVVSMPQLWNTHIAPWFTKEKWSEIANNAKNGVVDKFNEWKNNFNPINDWWNNKIKPWFTWEKWRQLGQDAINGIKSSFNSANLTFQIRKPKLSWSTQPVYGWMGDTLRALNLPASLPKLNIGWYAEGGFPEVGELFAARESGPELVGRIGNRSAVANNDQITQAIRQASYEGVSQALRENNGNNKQPINVNIGNDRVYSGYGEYVSSENNMYGTAVVEV